MAPQRADPAGGSCGPLGRLGNDFAAPAPPGLLPRRVRPVLLVGLYVAALLAGCLSGEAPSGAAPLSPAVGATRFDTLTLVTDYGAITAILYRHDAPRTVDLIEDLAREGYFGARQFTRVVPGHVIQETDATGGLLDDARRVPLEVSPNLHFAAGALGIARDVGVNSGGPEFFIMDYATSHLDGNYTVFGQVISGMDAVHAIARAPSVPAQTVPSGVPLAGGMSVGTSDRMATPPVRILGASVGSTELARDAAARLPMQVARNLRSGEFRHSLEWPADLHAGATSRLTWFVRPYNATAVPRGAATVSVDEGGTSHDVAVLADPVEGIFPFDWQPAQAGTATLHLRIGPETFGPLSVHVR